MLYTTEQKTLIYSTLSAITPTLYQMTVTPGIELSLKHLNLMIQYSDIAGLVAANRNQTELVYRRMLFDCKALADNGLTRWGKNKAILADIQQLFTVQPTHDEAILMYLIEDLEGVGRPSLTTHHYSCNKKQICTVYGDDIKQIPETHKETVLEDNDSV